MLTHQGIKHPQIRLHTCPFQDTIVFLKTHWLFFFKAPHGLSLFMTTKKDRVRFQSFPIVFNFFFFLKTSLEFYFHFFSISPQRLRNPWLIGSLFHANLDHFQGAHCLVSSQRSKSPWLIGSDFCHSFPDQRSPQTSIKPGLVHCLVRNQDWERRPTNVNNMASELKAPEPDSNNNDNEMPLEPTSPPRLRQEIFMSTPSQRQQPQHGRQRVFDNIDNHRHRDPNSVHRRGERRRREVPTTATSTTTTSATRRSTTT